MSYSVKNPMKIGVLALQGDFIEHVHMLEQLGARAVEVRLPAYLEGLDGLIIPIPRHRELGEGLADEIRRECEPKLGRG